MSDDDELLADLREALEPDPAARDAPTTASELDLLRDTDVASSPDLQRYRILGRLGAGGMGIVYEAEQRAPRRRVALKVLRPGLASDASLRRFQTEAELLGRLDHPGIARIVEAGSFDDGHGRRPFYAMEIVRGLPIVEAADRRGLALAARLELLARVADAVHHAHCHGVIHRDLKPANILVDEDGHPHVLDFGVALAIDGRTAATRATLPGQLVGTVAYMSPEQVRGASTDIDTRSDVYALGVILHELLCGELPHDPAGKSVATLVREIELVDPPRLAARRPELRGDLDAIVGKALEKDRERRYESAAALAADIRRHLRHEPVLARRPSAPYQLARLARRHLALSVAVASIVVLLVTATAVTWRLAQRAQRSEHAALARLARAETVQALLEDVLVGADPARRWGPEPRASELLREAAARVDGALAEHPAVEAGVRGVIGRAFVSLGAFDEAEPHLRRALALHDAATEASTEHVEVLLALGDLAEARGDERAAEPLRTRAVELARALPATETDLLATALGRSAGNLLMQGRIDEAERATEQAAALAGVRGKDVPSEVAAQATTQAALVLAARGHVDEATELLARVIDVQQRVLGRDHPALAQSFTRLAGLLRERGDHASAEAVAREALAIYGERLDGDHHRVADARRELGLALRGQQQFEPAADALREALHALERAGAEPAATALVRSWLGEVLTQLGDVEQGEALLRAALTDFVEARGERHLDAIRTRQVLSARLHADGRTDEALAVVDPAIDAARAAFPGSRWLAKLTSTRAWYLASLGRYDEAEPLFLETRRLIDAAAGELDDLAPSNLQDLVRLYDSWGRTGEAERWRERWRARQLDDARDP